MIANLIATIRGLWSNVRVKLSRESAAAVVLLGVLSAPAALVEENGNLTPVRRAQMCVTKGAIEEKSGSQLEVTVPEMRAVVAYPTRAVAEAKFAYLGPTAKDKPLRSGEIRRQFGLKLRAANGCNLVYAMWRIEPKPELVVSEKLNHGQTTNAECGTQGYHNIKPTRDLKTPALKEGESHTLRAEISRSRMKVYVDDKLTWEGLLSHEAQALDGPSGVRTDNGRFRFEFFSSEPVSGRENPPCHAADGDE
jgi:hypothetical protein